MQKNIKPKQKSICDACLKPFVKDKEGNDLTGITLNMLNQGKNNFSIVVCYKCMVKTFGVSWKRAQNNAKK